MKSSKKIMSLALAGAMLIGTASSALAAPTHIIIGNKAYETKDLTNDAYKANMTSALVAADGKGYIADSDGKTIKLQDLVTGIYATDYTNAPNKGNEITGDVKVVKGDLTEGEVITVPGRDTVEELKVESISAINATQVEVKFSKELDPATVFADGKEGAFVAGNPVKIVSLDTANGVTTPTLASLKGELSKDGKTLTVTSDQELLKRYDVTIDGFKTKDAEKLVKYEQMITIAEDKTAPTILSVEQLTAGTAKVKFSEPMNSLGTFEYKLENGKTVTGITANSSFTLGDDEVIINIAGAQVDGNNVGSGTKINITFIGATDQGGNILSPNPATVTVTRGQKDGVAPEVVSITQTGAKTFKIKFSEEIQKPVNGTIFAGTQPTTDTKKDETEPTVYEFTVANVLDGLTTVTTTGGSKIVDLSGEDADFSRVVSFTKDTIAPKVTSTQVITKDNAEYLEITFDKNVQAVGTGTITASGTRVKDYVTTSLTPTATSAGEIAYKNVNTSKKVVIVKLADLLAGASDDVKGAAYKIDLAFSTIESETGVAPATVKDVTFTRGEDGVAPNTDKLKVSTITPPAQGSDNDTVIVTFASNVDVATATNVANYQIDGAQVESASVTSDTTTTVTLKLVKNSNTYTGGRNITIQNVKQKGSTVAMDKYIGSITSLNENVRPTLASSRVATVTPAANAISSTSAGLYNNTTGAAYTPVVGDAIDGKGAKYYAANTEIVPETSPGADDAVSSTTAGWYTTADGQAYTVVATDVVTGKDAKYYAATTEIVAAVTAGSTIEFTFSENVKTTGGAAATYDVKSGDTVIGVGTIANVANATGKVLTVTINAAPTPAQLEAGLTLTEKAGSVEDSVGNKFEVPVSGILVK